MLLVYEVCVCVCVYIYVRMYVCMCVCVFIYIYIYITGEPTGAGADAVCAKSVARHTRAISWGHPRGTHGLLRHHLRRFNSQSLSAGMLTHAGRMLTCADVC
jgi:hypothetical protein